MAKNFNALMEKMPAERRDRIGREAKHALDSLALHELRKARRRTQAQVAASMQIDQSGVARIEMRGDMGISTLREYVTALGGRLEMRAVFPESTVLVEPAAARQEEAA